MADQNHSADLPKEIASAIREAIVTGQLIVDERLPSETELSETFSVSRPTVREALKRLAAQNLIRTKRGATGGAFVNRLSFEEARGDLITTSTLLLSMNEVDFDTACEARFTLERACAALSAQRRTPDHLATMRAEITRQSQAGLSDESFCASDVAFHRAFVDAAHNPVLSWQLAAAVEAIEPLMNMITYTQRDRTQVIDLHTEIANAVERRDGLAADRALQRLSSYTQDLARKAMAQRKAR
ncbi:FadR/GntR family transcriptional regulator [Halocynthiibacter sp.]|uniref:FadR/GntR family transcriptional regulator n=1 Tax=Halocynthiibacter sp. TaxID=1979210 RepID=UPI003C4198E4